MASSWHRFFLDAFVFFSYYNCYQKWFTLNCHAISSLHTGFRPSVGDLSAGHSEGLCLLHCLDAPGWCLFSRSTLLI